MTSTAYFKEHALKSGDTPYSMRGVAKAWANFNGTGTVAIRDSENVSSVTDNGTGDYSLNLATAMTDSAYSVTCGGNTSSVAWNRASECFVVDTSTHRLICTNTSTNAKIDYEQVHSHIIGDLA